MKGHQFKLVLPLEVRIWLAISAKENLRSMSSEVILAIREKMERTDEEMNSSLVKIGKEESRAVNKKAKVD